jgi:hypothetical protein
MQLQSWGVEMRGSTVEGAVYKFFDLDYPLTLPRTRNLYSLYIKPYQLVCKIRSLQRRLNIIQ